MDGHSGMVPPDPIPNSEVKHANVLDGTVLAYGKSEKLSHLLFSTKNVEGWEFFLVYLVL